MRTVIWLSTPDYNLWRCDDVHAPYTAHAIDERYLGDVWLGGTDSRQPSRGKAGRHALLRTFACVTVVAVVVMALDPYVATLLL